jgi:hypothetical protein
MRELGMAMQNTAIFFPPCCIRDYLPLLAETPPRFLFAWETDKSIVQPTTEPEQNPYHQEEDRYRG